MPSIIEEFNNDIFISYRQKDNKHDGWVTEFVNNLKGELESTFKKEISVYFDINPHDGLLETHDVDASLKEKLKCLIFIPIISRTYCDPKSFAWEHEFKAFVEQASHDQFGLKVTLPNGNIASRVLPVKIHDLDDDDITLCESVLGGVLRGIEFIYKESGVNRPLTPEDDIKLNLNKISYRNQINKIALAIKEILTAVSNHGQQSEKRSKRASKQVIVTESIEQFEKSVAVLPFLNDSPDEENTYFINGLMEEVLNNLQKIKDLRVISRTSVEQYRGQKKPISEIAGELGVNYIVEGSGQKYGNSFRIRIQLIMAAKETHLWGESYQQKIKKAEDIFNIQTQIAESIAKELKAIITPQEKDLIEKIPTKQLEAYDAYLKGQFYWRTLAKNDLDTAMQYFELAKGIDPEYALAYAGICNVWVGRQQAGYLPPEEAGPKAMEAAMKALELDNTIGEVHNTLALVKCVVMWDWEGSESEFKQAIELNPNYAEAHALYSQLLIALKRTEEAIEHIEIAVKLDPLNSLYKGFYCLNLMIARRFNEAVLAAHEALKIDPTALVAQANLATTLILMGKYEEGVENYKLSYTLLGINEVVTALDSGFAKGGYIEAFNNAADTLVERSKTTYFSPDMIAELYSLIGNKDRTLEWIERAFMEHDPNLIYLLQPIFDILRDEPRYQEIAKKMNLPYK